MTHIHFFRVSTEHNSNCVSKVSVKKTEIEKPTVRQIIRFNGKQSDMITSKSGFPGISEVNPVLRPFHIQNESSF